MAAKFSVGEIAKATGGVLTRSASVDSGTILTGISTDTRTVKDGEGLFALIGENHDAHDHLDEAADSGAALLVISDAVKTPESFTGAVIVVPDTLRAYQDLAAYRRICLDPFVIAVTGSLGKTTLKDMLACILSKHARVYSTQGNLNNQTGLPRTILDASDDTEILVLEMGMAYAGEIERLSEIAAPDVAVITNIGLSHRENFDSDDGILKAKYEITTFLSPGGTLVIDASGNADLVKLASDGSRDKGFRLLRIAREGSAAAETADYIVTPARVSGEDAGTTLCEIWYRGENISVPFAIPIPGAYAGLSAALASAACAAAGVTLADSAKALECLKRTKHRLDPIRAGGVLVIDDTYNANPDSAKSGLEYLKSVPAKRRIAVLANMNELGGNSETLHREVGAAAARLDIDRLYAFGDKAQKIADGAMTENCGRGAMEVFHFGPDGKEALIERLCLDVMDGDAVYVKGSRTMKMEEVVRALTEENGDGDV